MHLNFSFFVLILSCFPLPVSHHPALDIYTPALIPENRELVKQEPEEYREANQREYRDVWGGIEVAYVRSRRDANCRIQ